VPFGVGFQRAIDHRWSGIKCDVTPGWNPPAGSVFAPQGNWQACPCERDSVHLLVINRLGPDLESFPVEYSLAPASATKSGPPADWTRPNQLRATRSLPGRLPPIRGRLQEGLTEIEHMNHFPKGVRAELWGGTKFEFEFGLAPSRTKSGPTADCTMPNQIGATPSVTGRLPPRWRRLEERLTGSAHMNHFSRGV
jgi:hypothetical protein